MPSIELTEQFLAKAAGWEVIKHAKELVGQKAVLSSNWTPPILKGVVQEGPTSYRAGLVIKGPLDIENLCGCPSSRQWGTICVHSVAVGLRHLRGAEAIPAKQMETAPERTSQRDVPAKPTRGKRIQRGTAESLELHIILPPNLAQAVAHDRVMFCFEGKWSRGRVP